MGSRKCSACGHTMGITHAQYTQCPANVAKSVPASVPILATTIVEDDNNLQKSSVSSAFNLFNKKSDDVLSVETAITIINISDGLPLEQQTQILEDTYAQLDSKEKIELVHLLKDREDKLAEDFLVNLAKNPDTSRKVLKELRKWPDLEEFYDYPNYVRLANERGKLGWWRKSKMNESARILEGKIYPVVGISAGVGAGVGFFADGGILGGGMGLVAGGGIALIAGIVSIVKPTTYE